MRLRRLPAAGLAGAAAAVLAALEVRDRRRIAADPDAARLFEHPAGETVQVTSADGTRLHAEVFGPPDAPPIVLVHGWMCALTFWRPQVHELARDHRVVAYDLRGHGSSATPDGGDWSIDAMADDLEAVLEACAGGRPALMAGHSLGAMTIVAWASRHHGSVRRRAGAVALLNTGIGDLITESLLIPTPGFLGGVSDVLGAALLSAPGPLPPWPSPISHRIVRYVACSPSAGPAAVRFSEQLVLRASPRVRASFGREISRIALEERVEHLTVPTLVLSGARDRLTPPVHARRLAETLPEPAGLLELEDTGHMAPLERPDAVTEALRDLAARHVTRGASAPRQSRSPATARR